MCATHHRFWQGRWLLLLSLSSTRGLNNGFTKPTLGFNSWNSFACNVNETLMRTTMDLFVAHGLDNAGFTTIGVDDCWASARAPNGTLLADPMSFPSGMAALANYAHARGLKFGIYSSNSATTCAGRPGSFGWESQDAATFAAWGVDLLKYDNCGDQRDIGTPESRYPVMRDALNITGRPIVFAACEWAVDFPATWMAPVANSWRTTYDIQNTWQCVVPHVDWNNVFAAFAGPGHYNDLDILESGNGVLTADESRAHFSLWAIMKSPLLIGCDLRSPACIAEVPMFTNPEVLAVSQDDLGVQAVRIASSGEGGIPVGKSGLCGKEELPQNSILAVCNATDPLQQWTSFPNGTLLMAATGECLQLDSGQGGCCSQAWEVWTNNAASGLCNDPASCCGARQQLWAYDATARRVTNNASGQCLTVHGGGMHNVGVSPCTPALSGFQAWDWEGVGSDGSVGRFVSSATPPGSTDPFCLARTGDVRPGAVEVWAGPLAGGDTVVLFFNRNEGAATNISVAWGDLGWPPSRTVSVRDLWGRVDVGEASGAYVAVGVPVHGVALVRMRPV